MGKRTGGPRDAYHDLDEIAARARKSRQLYVSNGEPTWRGQVERRRAAEYRQPSLALERCPNPNCRCWPPKGSRAACRCLVCHTPLAAQP